METRIEETYNVMILAFAIIMVLIPITLLLLWHYTGNLYLVAYAVLESFIGVQNTAASYDLGLIAFATYGLDRLVPVLSILVVANIGRTLMLSFILAAVLDSLEYANFEELINRVKAKFLRNHVIICEYNKIAETLIKGLKSTRVPFVVVENKNAKTGLDEKKILSFTGDPTDHITMKLAGICNARAIVFVSENDVENILGAIVARKLNPKIKIMSRLSEAGISKKTHHIGVDITVIPEYLAGLGMGEYIVKKVGVVNG